MSGQLLVSGDDGGAVRCTLCTADAVGPCAHCRMPVCGDCCVLVEGSAKPWAVCMRCHRGGTVRLGSGWAGLLLWIGGLLMALLALLVALRWVFGGD